jgi:hypothetical protein
MAHIRLWPYNNRFLPVASVLERLRAEFQVVNADAARGQASVVKWIELTQRFADAIRIPGKDERLALLQSVQVAAVYVSFGDSLELLASCYVMPGVALFFESTDEVSGPARRLVERAGITLGYRLDEKT